ncbi:hypothetical protein HY640_00795 [Candidatus Woesearchaeota archaeon]|nr:hypothetical protein [Candidatus Woesearchaeota archaeon]
MPKSYLSLVPKALEDADKTCEILDLSRNSWDAIRKHPEGPHFISRGKKIPQFAWWRRDPDPKLLIDNAMHQGNSLLILITKIGSEGVEGQRALASINAKMIKLSLSYITYLLAVARAVEQFTDTENAKREGIYYSYKPDKQQVKALITIIAEALKDLNHDEWYKYSKKLDPRIDTSESFAVRISERALNNARNL